MVTNLSDDASSIGGLSLGSVRLFGNPIPPGLRVSGVQLVDVSVLVSECEKRWLLSLHLSFAGLRGAAVSRVHRKLIVSLPSLFRVKTHLPD